MDIPTVRIISDAELGADTTGVLDAVVGGETFTVTRRGQPVATLGPAGPPTERLVELLQETQTEQTAALEKVVPVELPRFQRAREAVTAALADTDPDGPLAAALAGWTEELPDADAATLAHHLATALNRDHPRRRAELEALVAGWRDMPEDELAALADHLIRSNAHRRRIYQDHLADDLNQDLSTDEAT